VGSLWGGEPLLSGLAGDAEEGADRGPGLPGLGGPGDGYGEGVFGGGGVLMGGGDPVQDVEWWSCG
jgi:hypothetical protein